MTLPEGSKFVCPRCGEPLQSPDAARAGGLSRTGLVLQIGLALLGAGVVTYKVLEGSGSDPASDPPAVAAVMPGAAQMPVLAANRPMPAVPVQTPQALPQPVALQQPAAQPPAPPPVAAPAPRAPSAAPPPAIPASSQAAAVQPTKTVLLRLAGSSEIGSRLARRLASGYLSLIGDSDITLAPGGASGAVEIVGMQTGQRETVAINSSSSTAGFTAQQF